MVKIVVNDMEIETERESQYVIADSIATSIPVGWISVEDQLPPDKHEVLYFATFQNDLSREIMVGHREGDSWKHCCMFFASTTLNDNVKVTHWMELPDYPRKCNRT